MTAPSSTRATGAAASAAAPRRTPGDDVVFLSASGTLGGAERALVDMVGALRALAPALRVSVVVAGAGPLEGELRALGADVVPLYFPGGVAGLGDSGVSGARRLALLAARAAAALPGAAAYVARLRRVLAERRPAIVHSNGFKMHVLGALTTPSAARLVWHLHDYTGSRAVMARALRLLAPRCSAAIANSRSVAEDARATLGDVPVTPIHNAVDLARFAGDGAPADLDARAGLAPPPPGTVRVGLVATLAWWKGHELFLSAIAKLPPSLPVRAYVVSGAVYETRGSQASLHALRARARALGVADRVAFTGFVADAPGVMRALDVVVHASIRPEPFGLVIAEAMAAGRAVVAADAGGARELVADGATALTFPAGDAGALAACLERLVADPALRARLGRAAAADAALRFGRDRLGRELLRAYASLGLEAAAAISRPGA